ncbi:hypothetical protein [Endozoicomonas euniceicola]|uniref:Uncharacterized protein n=1 Tax=Endozoicomonas euniceicola TaxID=1234143 RepID=A0ABY6GT55_9GAMM|nr:hypothetical protein [Endozoicomonas euniceicola]UYM15952.1 hypothetical protein NX720_24580 [Endozoicomonas euniceicola]
MFILSFFWIDIFLKNNISKQFVSNLTACVDKSRVGSGRGGRAVIYVTHNKKQVKIYTDQTNVEYMKENIGGCFLFKVYKHRFLMPIFGDYHLISFSK